MPKIAMTDALSFNTQPPEGGWQTLSCFRPVFYCFNTQPPEGGWSEYQKEQEEIKVSTHSRPKAAGKI